MPDAHPPINLAVIGTGYVGLVSGVCLATSGIRVACVDLDRTKIETLRSGTPTIHEPGLAELMAEAVGRSTLGFTTDLAAAVTGADAVILAVGTPTDPETGDADLSYLDAAGAGIAPHLKPGAFVIVKSTVPPGTNRRLRDAILQAAPTASFHSVSNPEFLREGRAIDDFMRPDRIVIGVDCEEAALFMRRLYASFPGRVCLTSIETAEITKYAANAFLATKIAFINEIADLCEKAGADVGEVAHGMGLDPRIAPAFLNAGPGYGGSCFPKDTLALIQSGRAHGARQTIVEAAAAANDRRKRGLAHRLQTALGGLAGKRVAILGLAFKPGTDDVRDSPAIDLIEGCLAQGASVAAHDPEAAHHPAFERIERMPCPLLAAESADAVALVTEWPDYARLSLASLRARMRGNVIVDFRNFLDPAACRALGFVHLGIGRPDAHLPISTAPLSSRTRRRAS